MNLYSVSGYTFKLINQVDGFVIYKSPDIDVNYTINNPILINIQNKAVKLNWQI